MDPAIKLTLNQVNYDSAEHDISDDKTLDSFSNLFGFEEDIKADDESRDGAGPVLSRKFKKASPGMLEIALTRTVMMRG